MVASIQTFPEFRDENGFTPVVRRAARPTAAPAADGFRRELESAAAAQQPAAAVPAQPARPRAVVAFRDESGGPQFDPQATPAARGDDVPGVTMFAEGNSPTVWDVLDFINPLQHIPVVNTIYREITGDQIGALPRLVGGALLGGPIGAAATVANLMIEGATGKDVGGHVLAAFRGEGESAAPATAVAAAPAAAPAPAPARPLGQEQQAAELPVAPAPQPETGALPVIDGPPTRMALAAAPAAAATATFMPLPPRGSLAVPAAPAAAARTAAPAGTPLPMPSAEAVRRAAAAQGLAGDAHPLIPVAATSTATAAAAQPAAAPAQPAARPKPIPAAAPAPAADPGAQAFVNRFMQAMDKYDRARSLGGPRED